MQTRARRSLLVSVFLLLPASFAQAATEGFTFTLDNATLLPGAAQAAVDTFYPQVAATPFGPALAAQLQLQLAPQVASLADQVRTTVNDRLAPLDFGPFLHNSSNAAAMAAKAMPADYATAFRWFSLSVGGGAALGGLQHRDELRHPQRTIDNLSDSKAPNIGVGANVNASLGINLGAFKVPRLRYFDLHRMEVYLSAMVLPLGTEGGSWQVTAKNFGGYLKYQVLREQVIGSRHLFHWHGLNVITGLGYSSTVLKVNTTLPASTATDQITVEGQRLNINAAWTGDAKIGADMRVYTIPVEVTSALQLLYALTLYGGAAVDFNIAGRAQLTASAKAPVTVTATQPGNSASVLLSQPRPSLTYDMVRKTTPVDVRGFVGLQLNAGVLGLFAQVSGDSSRAGGVHVGLRGFW